MTQMHSDYVCNLKSKPSQYISVHFNVKKHYEAHMTQMPSDFSYNLKCKPS